MKYIGQILFLCVVVIAAGSTIGCTVGVDMVAPDDSLHTGAPPPGDSSPALNNQPSVDQLVSAEQGSDGKVIAADTSGE